jgi:hypothetical protein
MCKWKAIAKIKHNSEWIQPIESNYVVPVGTEANWQGKVEINKKLKW